MLYNSLFNLIVCGGVDGIVTVFDAINGAKTIEFSVNIYQNARKMAGVNEENETETEITAIQFDSSLRRLLVATTSGVVSVWNFNSGELLLVVRITDCKYIYRPNNI